MTFETIAKLLLPDVICYFKSTISTTGKILGQIYTKFRIDLPPLYNLKINLSSRLLSSLSFMYFAKINVAELRQFYFEPMSMLSL